MEEKENLTIEEVIKIIEKISYEKMEIYKDPFYAIESLEFMDKYGLYEQDVKDIVKTLTEKDLIKGPVDDYNNERFKHPCWIFLKYVKGLKVKVYIKLKILNHKTRLLIYKIH